MKRPLYSNTQIYLHFQANGLHNYLWCDAGWEVSECWTSDDSDCNALQNAKHMQQQEEPALLSLCELSIWAFPSSGLSKNSWQLKKKKLQAPKNIHLLHTLTGKHAFSPEQRYEYAWSPEQRQERENYHWALIWDKLFLARKPPITFPNCRRGTRVGSFCYCIHGIASNQRTETW